MLVICVVSDLRALIRAELAAGIDARLGPDRLIEIAEAAQILSVSEDYIYHNQDRCRSYEGLAEGAAFSFNGIQKWIASRA